MFSLPCICIIHTYIQLLQFWIFFTFYFYFTLTLLSGVRLFILEDSPDKISDYQCRCYNINTKLLKAVDSQSCRLPKPRQAGCANNFYQILKLFLNFSFQSSQNCFFFKSQFFFIPILVFSEL